MITTNLTPDLLTENNQLDLEFIKIEESNTYLRESMKYQIGDWFQANIQITKLTVETPNLGLLLKWKEEHFKLDSIQQLLIWKTKRVEGSVSLNLCLKNLDIVFHKLGEKLTLFHIPIQLGLSKGSNTTVNLYVTPNDIYLHLLEKYHSFLKIQNQNTKLAISNSDIDLLVEDYQKLLDIIQENIRKRQNDVFK